MNFFRKKNKDQDQSRTSNGGTQIPPPPPPPPPPPQQQQQQQQQQPAPNPSLGQWSNSGAYIPPPAQQPPWQQNPYYGLDPRQNGSGYYFPQQQQQQMFAQPRLQEYRPQQYYLLQQPLQPQQQQQQQQHDFDDYHSSIVNGVIPPAPYPIVSSGMPLGQQGQSQSTGYYSIYPAINSTYITDTRNEGYTADNYTHNNNSNGVAAATGYVSSSLTVANSSNGLATGQASPPLSGLGSNNPQVLQRKQSYTFLLSGPVSVPKAPVLAKMKAHFFYPAVIGIDFGMRYSVVAHSYRKNERDTNQDLYHFTTWPHAATTTGTERVPTLSTYKKGSKQIVHWGYRAREEMRKSSAEDFVMLHNVKLHLDDRYTVRPLPNGLTVQQVIADYLRMLNEHIVRDIQRTFPVSGKHIHEEYQYSLTVPGHWSARAKDTMREAAIEAGLVRPTDPPNRLMLISEEEAMAIYALRQTACDIDLEEMDQFMLCHAPKGESVTLVVYEISKLVGQVQPLREVVRSFGPSCGSDYLDANMERLIERKLRNYRHNIPASDWDAIMTSFETGIRGIFDGENDQFVHIPTLEELGTDDEEAGVDDGYLVLTAAEIKEEVFEPVVADVVRLMRDTLQSEGKNCKALFMLGEFGTSQYMWSRIRQEFVSQVAFISRPRRPELAISRGAVYAGLDFLMRK